MRSAVLSLALVGLLATAGAHAGGPPPASRPHVPLASEPGLRADSLVVHVSGGAIDSAFRALNASNRAADFARDLPTGDVTRYQLVVLSRRATGLVELHARWTDVALVRSGTAVLRTGPAVTGRTAQGQGEYSGTAIPRARERRVSSGDVLVIPAGLAHQWR